VTSSGDRSLFGVASAGLTAIALAPPLRSGDMAAPAPSSPPPPAVVTPAGRFASIGFGSAPVGKHGFIEQTHHPVVHLAQHVISPLTASLFIFGVHKAVQAPAIRTYLRAAWVLARHGHKYPPGWNPAAAAAAAATTTGHASGGASVSRAVAALTTPTGDIGAAVVSTGGRATAAAVAVGSTLPAAAGPESELALPGEVAGPVPHPAPLDLAAEAAAAVVAREEADRSAVIMDHLTQM